MTSHQQGTWGRHPKRVTESLGLSRDVTDPLRKSSCGLKPIGAPPLEALPSHSPTHYSAPPPTVALHTAPPPRARASFVLPAAAPVPAASAARAAGDERMHRSGAGSHPRSPGGVGVTGHSHWVTGSWGERVTLCFLMVTAKRSQGRGEQAGVNQGHRIV